MLITILRHLLQPSKNCCLNYRHHRNHTDVDVYILTMALHTALKWQQAFITACTVVQAVVKATSQSNGKGQILTPWGSETPERISMKLGIYNRVAGTTTHANPCGAATTWVVLANTWKNTCCGFLGIPFFKFFFALFFGSRRARKCGPILTIYTLSLIHIWRCRRSTLCRSRWSPYH